MRIPIGYTYNVYICDASQFSTTKLGSIIKIPAYNAATFLYRWTLKKGIAHELFHKIQATQYTFVGRSVKSWWMEATAEYAAKGIVWPQDPKGQYRSPGPTGGFDDRSRRSLAGHPGGEEFRPGRARDGALWQCHP